MADSVNIIEMLRTRYKADQEAMDCFATDSETYKELIKVLPQAFPVPTKIYTKSCGMTDYDVCLSYILQPGEKTEPLRMLLSMLFGVKEWTGLLDKDDDRVFLLSTVLIKSSLSINLTISASLNDYFYRTLEDKGTYTIGAIAAKRFVPYEITRQDIMPSALHSLQVDTGTSQTVIKWWLHILDTLIKSISIDIPIPILIQGTFGSDHDVDFMYEQDQAGHIRQLVSSLYDTEWYYCFIKADGSSKLVTTITIDTVDVNIILNYPKVLGETMTFVEETPEYIQYRAVQESDPDYYSHLLDYYDNCDSD